MVLGWVRSGGEPDRRGSSIRLKYVTTDVRLFGRIDYDPVEQYRVTAFAPGVIDRIYVRRSGQAVRNGDPLFDIHSSELFYLEEQLFEILKELPYEPGLRPARGQRARRHMRPPSTSSFARPETPEDPEEEAQQTAAWNKYDEIRRKMQLLGLTEQAIEEVITRGRATGISTVTTPTAGIVLEQNAFKGAYVNTGETIFTIANPSLMWARLDAYESDFGWLRLGQDAEFQTDAFPGETFRGRIVYLDPRFNPQTRTFTVGVLYVDPQSRLKPNMLVRCVVHARMTADGVGNPGRESEEKAPLVIPETAPLITGERAVVYVAKKDEPGTYEGRRIVLGPRARGYYVVKSGLRQGEQVVVNGSFKIDSAIRILAKSSMMDLPGEQPALAHHYHGGTATMSGPAPMADVMTEAAADVPVQTHAEPSLETISERSPAGASRSFSDRMQELMKKRMEALGEPK